MRNTRSATVSMFVASLLAGCATLQIDVDVYKGPLTNEEEIQARQFASLAMAAKPVLAVLRNDLEPEFLNDPRLANYRDRYYPTLSLASIANRSNVGSAGGVGLVPPGERYEFKTPAAEYVNGVLSFYEDQTSGVLQAAGIATEEVRRELAIFDTQPGDARLEERLREVMAKAPNAQVGNFACWYADFFGPSGRESSCLVNGGPAKNKDRRRIDGLKAVCDALHASTNEAAALRCPKTPRSNEGFALLSDREQVRLHAKLIFGSNDTTRFEKRVVEIGSSFIRARQSMRDLWRAAMELVEQSERDDSRSTGHAEAQLLALTIQPRILACYWTRPGANDAPAERLRSLLDAPEAGLLSRDGEAWTEQRYRAADKVIADAAWHMPLQLTALLRQANRQLAVMPDQDLKGCSAVSEKAAVHGDKTASEPEADHVVPIQARTFGLVRGPTLEFQGVLTHIESTLSMINGAGTFSWERARQRKGLESMTSDLLVALDNADHRIDSPEVKTKLDSLRESLVIFAERLLFAVNNGGLFTRRLPGSSKSDTDTSYAGSGYGGSGDARPAPRSASSGDTDSYALASRTVLQTLGNTILLHANDLSRRERHRVAQRENYPMELAAAQAAVRGSPGATLDRWIAALRERDARSAPQESPPTPSKPKKPGVAAPAAAKGAASASETVTDNRIAEALTAVRSAVVAAAASDGSDTPAVLRRQLEKLRTSIPAKSVDVAAAMRVIEQLPRPPEIALPQPVPDQRKTQIAVMDDIIALLRQRRIQAIAQGSKEVDSLQNAINAAYEQRTSMVYLRPTADYLKNIYASTSLQDDVDTAHDGDAYRNKLVDGWNYWIPRVLRDWWRCGEASSCASVRDARRQLERLFWQNVNRVSLNGGGSSNYVIAKDDVGNWYVKSYSNDPEAIIRSAQSLALFNTGKGLNVDLLHRADLQRRFDKSTNDDERKRLELQLDKERGRTGSTQATFINKARDRYRKNYIEATGRDTAELATRCSGLVARLSSTWQQQQNLTPQSDEIKALSGIASAAYDASLAAAVQKLAMPPKPTPTAEDAAAQSMAILDTLNGLRRFRLQIQENIMYQQKPALRDGQYRQENAAIARQSINSLIADFAERRRYVVKLYEDGVTSALDTLVGP